MNLQPKSTVLVVDDDLAFRKAVAFDFKRKGYEVLLAENGTLALEIVKSSKVDVVISDIRMPGGGGVWLLDQIKELNVEVPVLIFISGFADLTVEDAYHKGAEAVFPKPYDRKALFLAVEKVLLPMAERWIRGVDVALPEARISLRFSSMESAVQEQALSLGRGGLFIAMKDSLPASETVVQFQIEWEGASIPNIIGRGLVRWVRTSPQGGLAPGCGIEFQSIEEASRLELISLIRSLGLKPYIPKKGR